jgi:hypothetical protein
MTPVKSIRPDVAALIGGVVFGALFTGLIAVADPLLARFALAPDQGPWWYYWKLPEPTFWSRLTSWGLYTLHQVVLWGLIYYAQTRPHKYQTHLHRVNIFALAANAGFIALHLVQTHLWYDGLAQDTPVWSSQWSVIIMLVWILLMENSRRGLFFGKKAPIGNEIGRFARKYHGYVFAWATVYTFWFHPTVSTTGHLIGFFYMFLLLLQGSLFFTRIHTNRWWMVTQEVTVLVHGALVAVGQGGDIWPMFAFGFGGLFVITQMHGLGLRAWVKWLILATYIGLALLTYSQIGLERLPQILSIPAIEYLSVFVLALLIGGGLWLARRLRPKVTAPSLGGAD